eukprot:363451-Chlamydomonas_euryale.AAC.7
MFTRRATLQSRAFQVQLNEGSHGRLRGRHGWGVGSQKVPAMALPCRFHYAKDIFLRMSRLKLVCRVAQNSKTTKRCDHAANTRQVVCCRSREAFPKPNVSRLRAACRRPPSTGPRMGRHEIMPSSSQMPSRRNGCAEAAVPPAVRSSGRRHSSFSAGLPSQPLAQRLEGGRKVSRCLLVFVSWCARTACTHWLRLACCLRPQPAGAAQLSADNRSCTAAQRRPPHRRHSLTAAGGCRMCPVLSVVLQHGT